jgi:hypothetical protein
MTSWLAHVDVVADDLGSTGGWGCPRRETSADMLTTAMTEWWDA